MSDDSLDCVIGPEFNIDLLIGPKRQDEVFAVLVREETGEDGYELMEDISKALVSRTCAVIHGFILSRKIVTGKIETEEEYEPWVNLRERSGFTIGLSICVMHAEADAERLDDCLNSPTFESFCKRELTAIVLATLKPSLPWITANMCEVEITGIGFN